MKKLLSLLLVLTVIGGILPVNVLAAEDTFTLSAEEYRRAVKKAGMDVDTWHEGMSWSDSMSAYQKYCYLSDFRDTVTKPMKNRYLEAMDRISENGDLKAETASFSLSGINETLTAMESKLYYFIFDLEQETQAVSNAENLISDETASTGDKADAYRRIRRAAERITELGKEIKAGAYPSVWKRQAEEIGRQLDAFFVTVEQAEARKAENIRERTVRMTNAKEADASFDVVILDKSQIGIEVRNTDGTAVRDAKVTLVSGSTQKTGYTLSNGAVIFPAGSFTMDEYSRMDAALRIEKNGYRIWESKSILITSGESVQARLEEDNGEPYVQYITFRGVDVAHDTEHVYYTPENDAVQSFEVGIHTYPGKSCTFSLTYTPAGSETPKTVTRTVTGTSNGLQVLDLKDKWCSMLEPEEQVIMKCFQKEGQPVFTRSDGITTEKAIVEKPLKQVTALRSGIPGTSFDLSIPLDLPGLKSLKISMALPWELLNVPGIHFNMSPGGSFVLSISVAAMKKYSDKEQGEGWKYVNYKQAWKDMDKLSKDRRTLTNLAMSNTKWDGTKKSFMNMLKKSFMASFCVILTGQASKRDNVPRGEDEYQGEMDLFVSAALDFVISFNTPYMVGPVPCFVGFDFSFGLQAAVDLPFTFTTDGSGYGAFDTWHNFSFDRSGLDIIISPRVSLAAYMGAGVRGFVGVYLRGYVGLSLNLHIQPLNKVKFKPEVVLDASLTIIAEFMYWSVRATLLEKKWQFSAPGEETGEIVLAAGNGKDAEAEPEYVRTKIIGACGMEGVTKLHTVRLKGDYYAFWIADKMVAGKARPWLHGAKVFMKKGEVTLQEMELPYIYALNDFAQEEYQFTDITKVIDFDLTSTDSIRERKGNFDMISVAVTLEIGKSKFGPYDLTNYAVYLYNIVFKDDGKTYFYSMKGNSFTDKNKDSAVASTGISISYAGEVYNEKRGCSDYYYDVLTGNVYANDLTHIYCTSMKFSYSPKPDLHRTAVRLEEKNTGTINLKKIDSSIDAVIQFVPVSARMYDRDAGFFYALCTLKGTEDEYGNKQTVLTAVEFGERMTKKLMTGVSSFRYIEGLKAGNGILAVVTDSTEEGFYSMKLIETRLSKDSVLTAKSPRDLGIHVSPAAYDLVNLGTSIALYYLESSNAVNSRSVYDDPEYNLRAVYLADGSDGNLYSTKPFHLGHFDRYDLIPGNGVPSMQLYPDESGFIHGFLTEKVHYAGDETVISKSEDGKTIRYTGGKSVLLKYFNLKETMQAAVLEARPEQTLVKPGDRINVLFSLKNTGNVPASKINLSVYAMKKGTSEKYDIADIQVVCSNPDHSAVMQNGMPVVFGKEAILQYDTPESERYDTFTVEQNGKISTYTTDVLMPEETHAYRAGLEIPRTLTPGEYQIFVTFKKMSTLVKLQNGRYDAVSAWTSSLYSMDGQKPGEIFDDSVTTLTMNFAEPVTNPGSLLIASKDGETPVDYSLEEYGDSPRAIDSKLVSAFATEAFNDLDEIPIEDADLSVKGRLSLEAGTETVHVVIRNEGVAEATSIVFTAMVDDEQTFSQSMSGVTLADQKALSFDLPLSEVTQGKEGENLILQVSGDSVETNMVNNKDTLPLNMSFMILRHPQDVFTTEGKESRFSVRARGGVKPYRYQWQVSENGQYGSYTDIQGATEQILNLKNIPFAWNGRYYRVVILDAEGRQLISNPALLVVSKIPVTGDSANMTLWIAMLVSALSLTVLLIRKKKRT